jgi:pentapeptide repeat protein
VAAADDKKGDVTMTRFNQRLVGPRSVAARLGLVLLPALVLAVAVVTSSPAQDVREAGNPRQGCPGCNLAGVDFSGRSLDRINLAGADLSGANFTGATLRGVMLSGANLTGANFMGARIALGGERSTSLVGANLSNTNFTGATLSAADLQYANISCANFANAVMSGVIAGPALTQASGGCKATFTGAQINCSLAAQSARFDFAGATMPTCEAPPTPSAAAASWSCPNATLPANATLIYVAPTGQDTSTCGASSTTPCLTIGKGLAQCTGASCSVLAYYGAYSPTSTIALGSNKSIYGGCVTSTPASNYVSIVNAPPGGAPAIVANNVTSSTLQGLSIVGSSVAATPANAAASVAMSITGNSNVALNYVTVTGGRGGNGAAGTSGVSGAAGTGASGTTAGTNTTCNASGGAGGPGMTAHVNYGGFSLSGCTTICGSTSQTNSCSGGSCNGPQLTQCNGGAGSGSGGGYGGGAGGSGAAYCNFSYCSYTLNNGNSGGPGNSGTCGTGGTASSNINGSYVNGVWTASAGGNGLAGGNGSGGGGGGGGQAYGGVCFWAQSDKGGGSGGGGGAGSCGASQGTGGQQGGASIALAVIQSTVTLNTVTVTAGAGGTAGNGGAGAAARPGGAGAGGASGDASTGGSGYGGGWGGSSGAGAGGNGGPSIGITFVSTPEASVATTKFYLGVSGGVGAAGAVINASGAPCQSIDATLGTPGRVSDYVSFN